MYSFVFQLITSPLGLPISPLYEYLILLVLNEIAFQIAWNASPGGRWGSEIHWAVRIPTFIIIWAITYGVIWTAKWVCANWILVVSCIGALAILGGTIALVVLRRKRV
ncbi:hypothetical protein [Oscillibacter sp.]|uniref:hypothetical protein n=1 Tax=Oscillibacter sp. TaxID=1945593 RepID=UPI00260D4DD4|nr:hypothetical protein [Oscillibacter sp.]MDD3346520.1 hypothetical protein [Oscillibacter sp.]